MTVDAILDEVRRRGATIYRTGNVLRIRPMSAIPPALIAELRTRKPDILARVPDAAERLGPLALVPQGSPHPPRIFTSTTAAGATHAQTRAADAFRTAGQSDQDWLGLRVASRVLGEDVWLVSDDESAAALEREFAAGGESTLVFTLAEVFAMEGMLAAEMQAIARVKRTVASLGGRLDSVRRRECAK